MCEGGSAGGRRGRRGWNNEGRILRKREGVSRGVLGVRTKGMKENEGRKDRRLERARVCNKDYRSEDCRVIRRRGAWRTDNGGREGMGRECRRLSRKRGTDGRKGCGRE